MASAHSKFDDFCSQCIQFELIKMLTHSLLVNYRDLTALVHSAALCGIEFLVHC